MSDNPISNPPLELNAAFREALDRMEKTKENIFITGKAGTGKSTLLKLFKKTTRKQLVVLAPTGIAALNVGGQTIHSFFGFPPKPLHPQELKKRRNHKLYKKLDVVIIDEISMVRADLLDNIDVFLRKNREIAQPFGGCQMIFFGDLFQLPPVVANQIEANLFEGYYETPFFFSAYCFQTGFEMEFFELNKVYRQEGRHFLRLLEAVRTNRVDYEDLEDLNERYDPDFNPPFYYITLSPRNALVDRINKQKLDQIEEELFFYNAEVKGNFDNRRYPTEEILQLKVGAQVMFVKNDSERAFVNGTLGKVVELSKNKIKVEIKINGKPSILDVGKAEWEVLKYRESAIDTNKIETETVGVFKQFPLKLAWAITIHKSQGKTFDRVIIDMGRGAFAPGQTYVALSRCRSLEGIVLKQRITHHDIMTNERVVQFYETNF